LLQFLIDEKGYTLVEVAELIRVAVSTIKRWRDLKRRVPASILPHLAAALGVQEIELLTSLCSPEKILKHYELPVSIATLVKQEIDHVGKKSLPSEIAYAAQIVNCLSPTTEKRRKNLLQAENFLSLREDVYTPLNFYVYHGVDHYLVQILRGLKHQDPTRLEEFYTNLSKLAELILREKSLDLDLVHYRVLENASCYLIHFGSPDSQVEILRRAKQLWGKPSLNQGISYVVRDIFHSGALERIPEGEGLIEDFLKTIFSERKSASTYAAKATLGCEILYFVPETSNPSVLLPEIKDLDSLSMHKFVKGVLAHFQKPLPEFSLVNYATVAILLIQRSGSKLFKALDQELVEEMREILERPTPSFSTRFCFEVWRETRRLFSKVIKSWESANQGFAQTWQKINK
jgi:transcriptional regulator with XRE-family HTH domain